MAELRWNPILKQWNIVSDARQDRPVLPEKSCPLCPGVLEVPQEDYYIVSFENRFPSLRKDPRTPNVTGDSLYRVRKNKGVCEVVLYAPRHDAVPSTFSLTRFENLIKVWKDRFFELGSKDFIDYVYIFENRGREIGVTLVDRFTLSPLFLRMPGQVCPPLSHTIKNTVSVFSAVLSTGKRKMDGELSGRTNTFSLLFPFMHGFPTRSISIPNDTCPL